MNQGQLKTVIAVLTFLLALVGGVWALESRVDEKIDRAMVPIRENVTSIRDDVKAVRGLLEKILLEDRARRPNP